MTAREKVRVARALEGLPQISDTFRQGKVSYSKVRAMTRIATPENEGYLLYIAENGTASDVESLVRAYRRASRGEDLEEARQPREERYLDMYTDGDGRVVIRGRLPQEVAALLVNQRGEPDHPPPGSTARSDSTSRSGPDLGGQVIPIPQQRRSR